MHQQHPAATAHGAGSPFWSSGGQIRVDTPPIDTFVNFLKHLIRSLVTPIDTFVNFLKHLIRSLMYKHLTKVSKVSIAPIDTLISIINKLKITSDKILHK